MEFFYDSKDLSCKKPFGCIKAGEKCSINVFLQNKIFIHRVLMLMESDEKCFEIPLEYAGENEKHQIFSAEFSTDDTGLYFYHFCVISEKGKEHFFKEENKKWQITVYDKDFSVPEDFCAGVMYQIFPDRFFSHGKTDLSKKLVPYTIHKNTDECPEYFPDEKGIVKNCDFYGGNFKGIEKKLPYIKSLGVSAIYLNPIFKAYSNHRYDTCDYKETDPMLGTKDDFKHLCDTAHSMGIKIILDGVFSHTGSNSIYFDKEKIFGGGACSGKESQYFNWYTFYDFPQSYESWWGIDTLPCVKEMEESYLDYIIRDSDSVIRHWLRLGADGFRLDVADELPDEFIAMLRKVLKEEKKDAVLIGEVWEDASNKVSYGKVRKYFSHGELDSVMNYPFRNYIIDYAKENISSFEFSKKLMTICENYPAQVLCCLMNSLSTHDTARIINVLSDCSMDMPKDKKEHYTLTETELSVALDRLVLCVALLFILPGCPCIYYGDEIGMQGFEDPFNRRYFDWEKEDKFCLELYKTFSEIRNLNPCLKDGMFLSSFSGNVLTITRQKGKNKIEMIVNREKKPIYLKAENVLFCHGASSIGDGVVIKNGGFVVLKNSCKKLNK